MAEKKKGSAIAAIIAIAATTIADMELFFLPLQSRKGGFLMIAMEFSDRVHVGPREIYDCNT